MPSEPPPGTDRAPAASNSQFDAALVPPGALTRIEAMLATRPRALLSDIDGTLSPIAPTPEDARLLPGIGDLLTRANAVFDLVALVSGRAAPDARRMVGLDALTYVGNHGLEELAPAATEPRVVPEALPLLPTIHALLDALERTLAPHWPALRIERKGITGSVHTRQTADPPRAERAILDLLAREPLAAGLRVTHGRRVIEIRPPVGVDKGTAIAKLATRHGLRSAIYLGDDRTDLDAFRALGELTTSGTLVGVRVAVLHAEAPAGLASAADLALPSIQVVPGFLTWLLALAQSS